MSEVQEKSSFAEAFVIAGNGFGQLKDYTLENFIARMDSELAKLSGEVDGGELVLSLTSMENLTALNNSWHIDAHLVAEFKKPAEQGSRAVERRYVQSVSLGYVVEAINPKDEGKISATFSPTIYAAKDSTSGMSQDDFDAGLAKNVPANETAALKIAGVAGVLARIAVNGVLNPDVLIIKPKQQFKAPAQK